MTPAFMVSGAVAVAAALMMVTRRNPIYAAIWLLAAFLGVAVVYLSLQAPFLAAIHVLVYTGAILVLFLFVIMLLNLKDDELGDEHPIGVRAAVAGMCTALFAALAVPIWNDPAIWVPAVPSDPELGSVEGVGEVLYRQFGLQFELVSLLIIVAMFGAVVLAKKKLVTSDAV
jgi:NADH-quinone oxidoreductase subunit J